MTEIEDVATARAVVSELLSPETGRIVVMSGAGISTESGIPDYRSPKGLWSKSEPIQFQDFVAYEDVRLEDWRQRFIQAREFNAAKPNVGHLAVAKLVELGRVELVITQNIDGLHERSGVPRDRLVELHGNGTYATCLDCGKRAELFDQEPIVQEGKSPRCPACGGLLKGAIVNFGQSMPVQETELAIAAAEHCDCFVVLGSSLVVHPAAQIPAIAAQAGARLIIINRDETPLDRMAQEVIRIPIGLTMQAILDKTMPN